MGCLGDSRLTLPCAAWKGWVDRISELQGMGAGQRDPRQESHRGGCGLARDLDGGRCSLGQKAPKLHCHTAALCWPREHYAQAARPGPWKWLLGGPLHRRHMGQLEYLLSLRHKPPAGPPNPISLGGVRTAPCCAQPRMPGQPQEGAAAGLCLSPPCRKLRSGLWAFTFLTFLEDGFFRFL